MAMIKIIRNEEQFRALKPEWDNLIAANQEARVFQTFDLNYAVWSSGYHKGDKLYILRAIREGHPDSCVIFPFCIRSGGRLEFIASELADVLDVVYARAGKNWHILFSEVAKFIMEQPEVHSFAFEKLEDSSDLLRYFGAYLISCNIQHAQSISYLAVGRTADFAAALIHLPSKDRSYVRSLLKNKTGFRFRLYAKMLGDEFPVSKIKALRDEMIGSGVRKYVSVSDNAVSCMAYLFDQGCCEVAALLDERGDLSIASFRLIEKNHINFWVVLYRDRKLVTLCDALYMAEKVKTGPWLFDWGLGLYSYKLGTFRPEVQHLYSLRSHPLTVSNFIKDEVGLSRIYLKCWLGRISPSVVVAIKKVFALVRGDNKR